MRWGQRTREAQRQWAELDSPGFRQYVVREALRRRDDGARRPARDVAFEVLEDVWVRTRFRRLANLAYARTLELADAALRGGAEHAPPAGARRAA